MSELENRDMPESKTKRVCVFIGEGKKQVACMFVAFYYEVVVSPDEVDAALNTASTELASLVADRFARIKEV